MEKRSVITVTRSVIPSLFTVMNLFSGFIAIKTAFMDADFEKAGWFIVLGALFDTLDGFMARLTHSASEFGVELDSLADVVTFGVAPSAIIYKLYFYQFETIGILIAALPTICGALRLARFNVQLVGFDKDYFKGLPIPSAAILIVSFVTFYFLRGEPAFLSPAGMEGAMFTVVIGASLMMVSTVKYETLPKPSLRAIKAEPAKFVVVISAIVASIITKGSAIFPFFLAFIIFGLIRAIVVRLKRVLRERRAAALFDEEELDREEKSTFGL
ncbi:MAG: CDP-diacylglycerol--serine O-phosphatidyltransferase [Bacteroidota bacterium]|nr:CDP-diacylglycerol--serine O-phosphatidyltransferase [Bacteroidota bacterium]MDP4230028.1 CDP-diacylglycerol--serine O-phosphatidyltransferase [Bacteroidota bacterium]MDP4234837.1 CDP-diacylglycerol--serine O-phosphatidyltransferase [Bacteroidota bacterium]